VDEFEHAEFVVFGVDAKGEKEACVPPVYNLVVPVLHANRRFSKGGKLTSRKLVILLSLPTIVRWVSVSIFLRSSSL